MAWPCHFLQSVLVNPSNVYDQARSSGRDHALHVHMLSELLDDRRSLQSELPRGHKDEVVAHWRLTLASLAEVEMSSMGDPRWPFGSCHELAFFY